MNRMEVEAQGKHVGYEEGKGFPGAAWARGSTGGIRRRHFLEILSSSSLLFGRSPVVWSPIV